MPRPASPSSRALLVIDLEVVTVTDTSVIITWFTGSAGETDSCGQPMPVPTDTELLLGEPGRPQTLRTVLHDTTPTPYHYAEVTGLEPGRAYGYEARSAGLAAVQTSLQFPGTHGSIDIPGTVTTLTTPPGRYLFTLALAADTHIGETVSGVVASGWPPAFRQDPGLPPYPEVMLTGMLRDLDGAVPAGRRTEGLRAASPDGRGPAGAGHAEAGEPRIMGTRNTSPEGRIPAAPRAAGPGPRPALAACEARPSGRLTASTGGDGLGDGPVRGSRPGERPAALIVAGDISAEAAPCDVARARELLDGWGRLGADYFVVRGNHDRPHTGARHAGGTPVPGAPGHRDCWGDVFPRRRQQLSVDEVGGVRIIGLDTTTLDGASGTLDSGQLASLRDTLSADRHRPTLVFGHHPVTYESDVTTAAGPGFDLEQAAARRLEACYGRAPGVFFHLAGHTHRNKRTSAPEAPGTEFLEIASVKEYPGGYTLLRLYTGGYMVSSYKTRAESARRWSQRTRGEYFGIFPHYALGTIADRNHTIVRDLTGLHPPPRRERDDVPGG